MAVSRPFLLVLIGVALLGATFFAVQQTSNNSADTSSAPAPSAQPEAGAAPAPSQAELPPQEVLRSAVESGFDSGRFDLSASIKGGGQSGSLELSGAVDGSAKQPAAEFELKVKGPDTDVEGGFVTTDGKAWFTKNGVGYAVPGDVLENLTPAADQAAAGAQPETAPANPVGQLPFDPSTWVKDVKAEGDETIDGVETQHISASVDAAKAARDVMAYAQQQGGQAVPLPQNAVAQVEKAVKQADFDVWVGKEDKVLRRLTVDLEVAVPGQGALTAALALNVSDVGEPQKIEAPDKVSNKLPEGEYGTFIQTVLEGSATVTGGDPALIRAGLQGVDNPQKLKAALRDNQKVTLFLANSRGLDDKAVEGSLKAVDKQTQAVVLTDLVVNVERYGSLVEDLGVNQTPAVVVIDTQGRARLIEGYVDGPSLVQVVRDAR